MKIKKNKYSTPLSLTKQYNDTFHRATEEAITYPSTSTPNFQSWKEQTIKFNYQNHARILMSVQLGCIQSLNQILQSLPNDKKKLQNINHKFTCGSALITASNFGNLDICELLLNHGADVNINITGTRISPKGTALYHAAVHNHKDICQLLINHGANVNPILKEETHNRLTIHATLLESILSEYNPSQPIISLLRQYGAQDSYENMHRC